MERTPEQKPEAKTSAGGGGEAENKLVAGIEMLGEGRTFNC